MLSVLTCNVDIHEGRLCTLDFPAFQAGSADIHLFGAAFGFNTNGFDVRFPDSVRSSMRMADIIAKMNILSADTAFCHCNTSPEWISIFDGTQFAFTTLVFYQKFNINAS
jgi:hypothetical protein